jgi:hypothetical protein
VVVEPCVHSPVREVVRISTGLCLRLLPSHSESPSEEAVGIRKDRAFQIKCSYIAAILQLLAKVNRSSASSAFLMGRFLDFGYVRVAFEVFAESAAKDAHARAVDDSYPRQTG